MRGLESARVCAMQWRVLTAGWGLPCNRKPGVCVRCVDSPCEAPSRKRQVPQGVPATASYQGGKRGQIYVHIGEPEKAPRSM